MESTFEQAFTAKTTNLHHTKNNALTHKSSLSSTVDLFFNLTADKERLKKLFLLAMKEDIKTAIKIAFYSRDPRNGQGMRDNFRILLAVMCQKPEAKAILKRNLDLIPQLGRYDDLLTVMDLDKSLGYCAINIWHRDLLEQTTQQLAAKWLPRESSKKDNYKFFARRLAKAFGLTSKEYRKLASKLSTTVEQQMCAKKWEEIEYQKVPSQAMYKLSRAFTRNDNIRFNSFKEKVATGNMQINSGTVWPHQLIQGFNFDDSWDEVIKQNVDWETRDLMWNGIPSNFIENTLCCCDTSGSMTKRGTASKDAVVPLDVSIGLGLYTAKHNKGPFHGKFITFSDKPTFHNVNLEDSLFKQIQSIKHIISDTNVDLIFDLILETAIENNLNQSEIPNRLLIISDMEFNVARSNTTNWKHIRNQYAKAGYQHPEIIFWNVASTSAIPVTINDEKVAIISGYSPSIIKSLNKELTPTGIMQAALNYFELK